jgi:hypothetical protein
MKMAEKQEQVTFGLNLFKCFHHLLYLFKIERSSLILVIVILSQILASTSTVLADEDLTCQKGVSGFPGGKF